VIAPSLQFGKTPFGGVSLPALKEYLQGEQLYRHGLWDSALVHYSRATELDSGFALAYRRMFLVLGWTPSTRKRFESADAYGLKAAALNQGSQPAGQSAPSCRLARIGAE
jgi:hypothetical protein